MRRAARRDFMLVDSDDDEGQSQEFNIPPPISLPSDEESMPLSRIECANVMKQGKQRKMSIKIRR